MSRRKILLYASLVLGTSWAIQGLLLAFLGGLKSRAMLPVGILVMWSPTLLAFVFMAKSISAREGVLWRLGRLAYLPVGVAVETATGFAVVAILVALGTARSGWFVFAPAGVTVHGGPWLLGLGPQAWQSFLANVTVTAIAFSTQSLIGTAGEEFAWRAFLQGHLIRQFGVRPGILIVAAIWSAWHLPVLLAGFDFPQYPILGAFILFPLQMFGASFFFGWLTIRARSFWPAALAHGAVNSIQDGVIGNLDVPLIYADSLKTILIVVVGGICWFAMAPRDDARGSFRKADHGWLGRPLRTAENV